MTEYWFNVRTRTVEEGRQSPWEEVMGPYPTRAAAEHALQEASRRTEAWDTADEEWENS